MEVPGMRITVAYNPREDPRRFPLKTECSGTEIECFTRRVRDFFQRKKKQASSELTRRIELSNFVRHLLLSIINLPGYCVQGMNAQKIELLIIMGILFVIVTVAIVIAFFYK